MAFDTFDTDSVATSGITFSNGDLTALGGGTALTASAVAQTIEGKTSGKWYVEFTCVAVSGNVDGVGIVNSWGITGGGGGNGFVGGSTASAPEMGWAYFTNNHVTKNNTTQTSVNNTTWGAGDVIGLAIDLDNKKVWWRKNTGNWVGTSGTPDPATNTSGFDISTSLNGNTRIYPCCNLSGSLAKFTANFGASAFTGTVPSGFTSGWTNTGGVYFGTFACSGKASASGGVSAPPLNNKAVSPYTSSFTGTLDHVIFPWSTNNITDVKGLVYDATGTGGLPGARLGISTNTITAGTNGEITFSFSGVSLTSGTKYWLGFVSDTSPTNANNSMLCPPLTSGIAFNSGTYASPTDPFGASPSTANFRYPALAFQLVTNTDVNATGVSASGSAAAVTIEVDKSVTASGVSGAGSAAATVPEIDKALTGVSGAGAAASVTVTYPGTAQVSGVAAHGAANNIASSQIALTAVTASGAVNPVIVTFDANISVTGVSAAAHVNAVTPIAVSPTILLPVFSIMRDVPVAANGNMSDEPVPAIGAMTNVLPIFSLMRNTPVASSGSMSNTPVAATGTLFAA